MNALFSLASGDGPLVATAVHDGHRLRQNLQPHIALSEADRLREEDPFTGTLTAVAPTRIVGLHSRFEVDLNRPRDGAVYRTPEDAWGLQVWDAEPPDAVVEESLARYDAFYACVRGVLEEKVARHGGFVLYDVHSYNHRRDGPDAAPDDPEANPEVNVGTGSVRGARWRPVVEAFMGTLAGQTVGGLNAEPHRLDVRENVKFKGGHFPTWVNETFGDHGCALAIEFRKDFMDEWTGRGDPVHLRALIEALRATVAPVLEALEQVRPAVAAR